MIELKNLTVKFGGVAAMDAISATFTAPVSGIIGRVLEVIGLTDRAHQPASDLNAFERRLTDVARCLVGRPKITKASQFMTSAGAKHAGNCEHFEHQGAEYHVLEKAEDR